MNDRKTVYVDLIRQEFKLAGDMVETLRGSKDINSYIFWNGKFNSLEAAVALFQNIVTDESPEKLNRYWAQMEIHGRTATNRIKISDKTKPSYEFWTGYEAGAKSTIELLLEKFPELR